jgi:hypothetical protein
MPTRDTAPIGAPCWVDLMTSDTERRGAQPSRRSRGDRPGDPEARRRRKPAPANFLRDRPPGAHPRRIPQRIATWEQWNELSQLAHGHN